MRFSNCVLEKYEYEVDGRKKNLKTIRASQVAIEKDGISGIKSLNSHFLENDFVNIYADVISRPEIKIQVRFPQNLDDDFM